MNIRKHWYLALVATALVACGGDEPPEAETAGDAALETPAPATSPPDGTAEGTLQDPQIVSVLMASDSAEINPSQLAVDRGQHQDIKSYAQMMIQEHGTLEDSLTAMTRQMNLSPAPSPVSEQIRTQAQTTMQQLQGLQGAEFDRAYAQAMLQSHQATLNTIDTQLLPSAQNPQLRSALEQKVRPAVAKHLERIQQIQGALGGS